VKAGCVKEDGRKIPVRYDVDVLVAGAGLAGFGAAILKGAKGHFLFFA